MSGSPERIAQGSNQRVAALREVLAARGLDGIVVPRGDEFMGETVPASAERLAWLTGFTGSAGIAVLLRAVACVFTDGRYTVQVARQTDPAIWERRHMLDEPAPEWIAARAPAGRIGYDPWLFSERTVESFAKAGLRMEALEDDPIAALWHDRPAAPATPIVAHPVEFAGRESAAKRADIAGALRAAGQDAAVLSDPASVAWLLNLRAADLDGTPLALAFALVHADGAAELFTEPSRIDPSLRTGWGNAVSVTPRDALPAALAALRDRRVRLDPAAPAWFASTLRAAGATVASAADPCALPKACKNPVEQRGARSAQARDGNALVRFLIWLGQRPEDTTEIQAAARLRAWREQLPRYKGESFPAISAAGEHGALPHYHPTPESDRVLGANTLYLIDSGGQYLDGTTDVTRTVWLGPDDPPALTRDHYTRVLKGHVAMSRLVFPPGVTGIRIDALARRSLWEVGLDYDHGTGHGVGSYLSVHEGPAGLSKRATETPIAPGMILSNEPGLYLAGEYGIRIENLMLAREAEGTAKSAGGKPFLCFETLTLAPYDRALIETGLLDGWERDWIDAYHARVLAELGPSLPGTARDWLAAACAPLI